MVRGGLFKEVLLFILITNFHHLLHPVDLGEEKERMLSLFPPAGLAVNLKEDCMWLSHSCPRLYSSATSYSSNTAGVNRDCDAVLQNEPATM